jgi:subtilisin family serine protease
MRRFANILSLCLALCVGLGDAAEARVADAAREVDAAQEILVLLRLPPAHLRPNADYGGAYGDGAAKSVRRRLAARIAHAYGLDQVTDWPMPLIGLECIVLRIPDGRSSADVAARLSKDPAIEWSQPMALYRGQGAAPAGHNDPLFRAQPAAGEWRLSDLHEIATGRNVRVAVIDSAIDGRHPDLAGQVSVSADFVRGRPSAPEQHGTAVAGVIAAIADNNLGMVGVAPRARLMALRACWQSASSQPGGSATVCDTLSLAQALYFAITHGAQVINLSLSGPSDRLLGKLLDSARERGATVVCAYDRKLPGGGFPASHPGVLAVAEEGSGEDRPGLYLAPGRDIPTTGPGGRWFLANGSSYAAAHVTGLVALLRERNARGEPMASLIATRAGGGRIDACATMVRAAGACDCACARAAK